MDGLTVTLIAGLYASMFTVYYRLGKLEQKVKDLCACMEKLNRRYHA